MTAADPLGVGRSSGTPAALRLALVALPALAIVGGLAAWLSRPGDAALRREAESAAAAGRWEPARSAASRIAHPTDADRLLRATAAHALKREDEAADALAAMRPDGPLGASRALLLGQVEQARHRARPMEQALRKALKLDPGLSAARRLLVYLYGLQERRPELMAQFAALAERGPVTVDLALHWGLSHGAIGDPAEARADLEKFVRADPDDLRSRLALAEVERRLGRFDEMERTLASIPDSDPRALAIRAQAAFDRGENEAGMALLARGPEDDPVLALLRGRRALARRDGAEAVRHLKRANAADPGNQETLFVLAQALRLAGATEEAERVGREAAAHQALRSLLVDFSNSTSPRAESFRKIASACEAVGRADEAIAWYRLAVTVDPLDTQAQKALYRLKASGTSR